MKHVHKFKKCKRISKNVHVFDFFHKLENVHISKILLEVYKMFVVAKFGPKCKKCSRLKKCSGISKNVRGFEFF